MSVEFLTYAALGDRLKISPAAARSLARRLRSPRSLSDDGKALVSIDLAEVRHTPHPPAIARQATSPCGRHKWRHCRRRTCGSKQRSRSPRRFRARTERADRLITELLQATAETTAAKEATARLEGEVAALRTAAEPLARSTATEMVYADWGVWLRLW